MKDMLNFTPISLSNEVHIKLYDANGNLKHSESGFNIVRDWYTWALKLKQWRDINRKSETGHIRNYFSGLANAGHFDNIYLTDHTETPSASGVGIDFNSMSQDRIIGYATKQDMTIGDAKKGVIVKAKCYETNTKVVNEFQWGTNQSVGTIRSILHSRISYGHMDSGHITNPNYNYIYPYNSKQMYTAANIPCKPKKLGNGSGSSGACVFKLNVSGVDRKLYVSEMILANDVLTITAKPFGDGSTELPDVSVVFSIPWQQSLMGGYAPTSVGIIANGSTVVVVASEDVWHRNSAIFKSTDNGVTWTAGWENSYIKDTIWSDGVYLYGQTWNNGNVHRKLIADIPNGNSYDDFVILGSRYWYFDGKLRQYDYPHRCVDIATIDWDAHTHGGYIYENISTMSLPYACSSVIDGKFYSLKSVSQDGGGSADVLCEIDLSSQPAWYTSHYKLTTPISKAAEETLVIQYVFNVIGG